MPDNALYRGRRAAGTRTFGLTAALALASSIAVTPAPASDNCAARAAAREEAMIRLAADQVDRALGAVADSTRALGDAYARLAAAQPAGAPANAQRWLETRTTRGNTTGVRTWPAELARPPAFQASYPGFYGYNGADLSDAVLRQLDLFDRLVPTFRSAYESFPFSWVYVTTVEETMMICPYVPIAEAVNNGTPTGTAYYKAADFEQRAVGWTAPYLDLVGAGMMVTASYPIYAGDELLGVMSRDITLDELAQSVLSRLAGDSGAAIVVHGNGLAIAASDAELAAEIDAVNGKAGAAVLHYRTGAGLTRLGLKDAVVSAAPDVDSAVQQALAAMKRAEARAIRLELDGGSVLAAPVARTGWLVVLMLTSAG